MRKKEEIYEEKKDIETNFLAAASSSKEDSLSR